ncbi:DNA polymerase IV [candidate division WOR-3 bacterium]|uniref:DNA polymerase IV n=1 Tax=candidate division WOR-3 bacterium TaxID=2052148 RepID=A0A660SCC6_UNCW3|nr:MAG: DNA polymerase IV [candidate division WOR-3 bacterium]
MVSCASYEARAYGIKAGMPLAAALRLCPHAIFLRGNWANYREYSEKFFKILEKFSPVVEPISLDEAYLDITGTERLFGPPRVLGERIRKEMARELGLSVTVGIGRTRTIARIATDLAKPDGLLIIHPGDEERILGPLPVSYLPGIGPKLSERLELLGVKKIGDLMATPEWILRLVGMETTPSERSLRSISRETTLAEDSNDQRFLESLLFYLTDRVATAARKEGVRGETVMVKVRFSDFTTFTRTRRVRPTNLIQELFPVACQLFHSITKGVRKRVRLIGVGISSRKGVEDQLSLFTTRGARINQGVDQVRERFGFSSLLWAKEALLRRNYPEGKDGYRLHTPSLSQ